MYLRYDSKVFVSARLSQSVEIWSLGIEAWADLPEELRSGTQRAPDLRTSRELQESLGPSGPETPKKCEKKVSRGLRPWGPKKSGKSLEKVRKVWKKSRKCLFGTFSRLFGTPGAGDPGRLFADFLGFRAQRARDTPVARGRVRKSRLSGSRFGPWPQRPGISQQDLNSGVAPANQTKERSVHELFAGAFRNKSSMWIVLVFLRKNTWIHKNGRNSWTFSGAALSLVLFAGATPDKRGSLNVGAWNPHESGRNLVGRGPRSDLGFPRTDTRSILGRFFAIRYAIAVATLLSWEANVIVLEDACQRF